MGVFSNNRVLSEGYVPEEVEPNMNYDGTEGAYDIMTEMVKNDFALFESIIKNDIQEAELTYRMNNGEESLLEQVEALNEASISGFFNKIKEFLKNVWSKISGLFTNIFNKMRAVGMDNKKLVSKFEGIISKKRNALEKMKFKWADLKQKDFKYNGKTLDQKEAQNQTNGIIDVFSKAGVELERKYDYDNSTGTMVDATKQQHNEFYKQVDNYKSKLEDGSFKEKLYNEYGITPDDINSSSSISKACHSYFFDIEDEKDGKFDSYQKEISDWLKSSSNPTKPFEDNKKAIDTFFNKEIKKMAELQKEYDNKKKSIYITGEGLYKGDSSKLNDNNVEVNRNGKSIMVSYNNIASTCAKMIHDLYQEQQNVLITLVNNQINAVKFYNKQCRRVWIQAATYGGKAESGELYDDEFIEAIGEAADYETDMLIG